MTELTGDLVTTGDRPVVMAWEHLLPLLTDADVHGNYLLDFGSCSSI